MMQPWRHKISIVGFRDAEPGDFPVLSRVIYTALGPIVAAYPDDEDLEEIRDRFHTLGFVPDEGDTVDDFDEALARLYDWGDINKRLWVGTP